MGQNLKVFAPELATKFRTEFEVTANLMQAMQSKIVTNIREILQTQAEDFKNVLADSLRNVVSSLMYGTSMSLT